MLSAFWRRFTGLFGCIRPSDDLETTRKRSENEVYFAEAFTTTIEDYLEKVNRVMPNNPKKCDEDARQILSFSTKLDKLKETESVQELMSSYCEILKEISHSSILIACSLALSNAQFLREKCKELCLLKGVEKTRSKLKSSISLIEMNLAQMSQNQDNSFSFWPHGSLQLKGDKLDTMRGIIKLLQLELLSTSHLIRYLTNKKRGRGQRFSLDLHGCNPAHAWLLASSAMDKMIVGEKLELITGNGIDSKNGNGRKYRTIREDFQEKFPLYNRSQGMAFEYLGYPPKDPTKPEELNEGVIVVERVRPLEPILETAQNLPPVEFITLSSPRLSFPKH